MRRPIAYAVIALLAATAVIEATDNFATTGSLGFARPAEAVVGRPLTPVSVAGVARRTTRRCVATVVVC